jgi:hypothetical protein
VALLEFPPVCLIMRHFATQKLATGTLGVESNLLSFRSSSVASSFAVIISL